MPQLADQGAVAVVAQPSSVNAGRHKIMSQCIHFGDGGQLGDIAVVISIDALGQGGAGSRFHRYQANVLTVGLVAHKRKGDTGKVAAAAAGTKNHIGLFPGHPQLLFCLQTDNSLVEAHMVENAAEGIIGVVVGGRILNRFTDRDAEGTGCIGALFENAPPNLGEFTGRRDHIRAPHLHQILPIGFLCEADPYHVDCRFNSEERVGQGQRAAPLPCPGFGRQALYPCLLIVP